jgi:hypothetical protein
MPGSAPNFPGISLATSSKFRARAAGFDGVRADVFDGRTVISITRPAIPSCAALCADVSEAVRQYRLSEEMCGNT